MSQPKPVPLYTTNAFKLEGEHVEVGTVLLNVEPELAKELTASGRTRLATDEEVAAATKKPAKA